MVLQFFIGVLKWSKIKVRIFLGQIHTFAEVTIKTVYAVSKQETHSRSKLLYGKQE